MEVVKKEIKYELDVDGIKYNILHLEIWDKHYPKCTRWETYINGEHKPHRWSGDFRITCPSKSEMIKHIRSTYYG